MKDFKCLHINKQKETDITGKTYETDIADIQLLIYKTNKQSSIRKKRKRNRRIRRNIIEVSKLPVRTSADDNQSIKK